MTLGKLALLLVSMGFFLSKALGVRYFRPHCRWAAMLAFAIICGLVHGELRQDLWAQANQPIAVLVLDAAVVAAAIKLRRVGWKLVKSWSAALSGRFEALVLTIGRRHRWLENDYWLRQYWIWIEKAIPRGPPMV